MSFPFPIEQVPGGQALQRLAELQQQGGGIAVILGGDESLEMMEELYTLNSSQLGTAQQQLEQAQQIDALQWFEQEALWDEDEGDDDGGEGGYGAADVNGDFGFEADGEDGCGGEDEEDALHPPLEWPASPAEVADREPLGHLDPLSGQPLPRVALCKVPAQHSWQVPCHLMLGNWNACPSPAEMAAVLRYWEQKYGARVVSATHDTLEMRVARPPQTREAALALAQQQYLFCDDLVNQGTGDVENLAKGLLYSPTWYFWWD